MEEEKGERIYTIPLRNVKRVPRWKRGNRAITEIKKYLKRHTKADDIFLGTSVNERIWKRGAEKPPSKIRVRVIEEEEEEDRIRVKANLAE
jgi:large subunit ribosomal protein L31e